MDLLACGLYLDSLPPRVEAVMDWEKNIKQVARNSTAGKTIQSHFTLPITSGAFQRFLHPKGDVHVHLCLPGR